jgi:hypothetical protein
MMYLFSIRVYITWMDEKRQGSYCLSYGRSNLHSIALSKNITIFWRETTAVHFNTIDGYWNNNIGKLQSNHSAVCVPSSAIDAPVSYKNANGLIVPFMKTLGIPVLSAWEASFFIPEMCHVGEGRDCLHFLLPRGLTTYFNEVLIQHILDLA